MRTLAHEYAMPEQAIKLEKLHTRNTALWKAYEKAVGADTTGELWLKNPPEARVLPEICLEAKPS